MKWAKGKICYYCPRAYEVKYAKLKRKALKAHVQAGKEETARFAARHWGDAQ